MSTNKFSKYVIDNIVVGTPISSIVAAGATIGLDSAAVTALIDSDYVQQRETSGLDSAEVIALIDSDYVAARTPAANGGGLDSAAALDLFSYGIAEVGSNQKQVAVSLNTFVDPFNQTGNNDRAFNLNYTSTTGMFIRETGGRTEINADASGTSLSTGLFLTGSTFSNVGTEIAGNLKLPDLPTTDPAEVGLLWNDGGIPVFSGSTAPTGGAGLDSAAVEGIVDSAYVQARVTLDGVGLDSAGVTALVDSDYVAARAPAASGGLDSAAVNALIDAEVQDPSTLILGTSSNVVTIGSSANGGSGVAIGPNADASGGFYNVAIGNGAKADTQIGTTAIGNNAQAKGIFSSAYGRDAFANNQYALALGYGVQATGAFAKGIGGNATGNYSVGVGGNATGVGASALGYSAVAAGQSSVALGNDATTAATAQYGIAIGKNAGADNSKTIHINATGLTTNQPQTANGIVIETSAAGSLTYDTTNDWTFGSTVNAPAFVGDGSGLTNLPSGGGGLDSAAVTALVDSDYVGGRVPPVSSYRLSSYFSIPAVYAEVNDLALGNGAQVVDPSGGAGTMNSIAIGQSAETRGAQSISIGQNAITNANFCTVVGANAGTNASSEMVCVGNNTNADTQSTSVGYDAGVGDGFSARNVALGYTAGKAGSTVNSVAIGNGAGSVGSGRNSSIAIGYLAGQSNQAANNIIVNATGSALNRTDQFGIDIRTSTAGSLTYDTTNDWTFGAGVTMTDLTASGVVIFSALPTSDPVNAGQLWNDSGTLKVSAG